MDYISESIVNNTSNATDYLPYSKRIETYLAPAVFASIFIVGILGNGTIIITFLKNQSMRNIPNTYVVNNWLLIKRILWLYCISTRKLIHKKNLYKLNFLYHIQFSTHSECFVVFTCAEI